ncbi:MAG: DUF3107 domain-containing protein [Candidatus Nanopelagicales bacterium]
MEVKIGVQQSAREITLETDRSAEDITAAVRAALADDSVLALEDDKGRSVLVPADRIAYVEISPATARRVGFGS